MTVAEVNRLAGGVAERLDVLQYRQELHDRIFHTDIYTLTKPHRLQHLVLHQCKYIAKLYELVTFGDDNTHEVQLATEKVALDGFIVAMSMLNVCNKLLSKDLALEVWEPKVCVSKGLRAMGALAKIVEDIDHMVMDSPLTQIHAQTIILATAWMNIYCERGSSLDNFFQVVLARLVQVETYNMYYERHSIEIARLMSKRASPRH